MQFSAAQRSSFIAGKPAAGPFANSAPLSSSAKHFCTFGVTFVSPDGGATEVLAKAGQSILEVAQDHDIDIEGACGGECACSTCHIILESEVFESMPEPDEDEADMLDLAAHVTDFSRLGCQVKLQKERDSGIKIILPEGTSNLLG